MGKLEGPFTRKYKHPDSDQNLNIYLETQSPSKTFASFDHKLGGKYGRVDDP